MHFKKLDNFYLFHLIVEKLDVFNFHPIFPYCDKLISYSRARFEHVFLKINEKWKYYREEKQDFWYSLILKCRQNKKKMNSMKSL